jgi:hypothetical protein
MRLMDYGLKRIDFHDPLSEQMSAGPPPMPGSSPQIGCGTTGYGRGHAMTTFCHSRAQSLTRLSLVVFSAQVCSTHPAQVEM